MNFLRMGMATLAVSALIITAAPTSQGQPPRGKGGGGFGMQGLMRGGAVMLLTNPSVQEELKLSDEQKSKLRDFADKQQARMREMFADGGFDRERMQEMMQEAAEQADKLVKETLNKDQVKRFNEIKYQQAGVAVFDDKEVKEALKLKDDQVERIRNIRDEMQQDLRELMQEMRGGGGDFREMREKTEALRKESMEKAQNVLTSEQKAKFKEMLGKPFELRMGDFRRPGGEGDDRPRGKGDRGKGKTPEKKGDPPAKSNPKIDD